MIQQVNTSRRFIHCCYCLNCIKHFLQVTSWTPENKLSGQQVVVEDVEEVVQGLRRVHLQVKLYLRQ